MSRRPPNPGAERAAQNQQTLKTLVKLESNKSCADCKKNKHPRWASWNLGIFLCIRCSGVHRGMGTHISRVKSVDLDAWTDEQMQNMIRWGNARANKYWEAKLAPGHAPSEDKIQNFIRTKYDTKRWVMDGGMPDPATLDAEADDEIPLNVVQEKAKMGHARQVSTNIPPPTAQTTNPDIDLFGDNIGSPPTPKATNTSISPSNAPPTPPKSQPAATKQQKTSESLLGFDFFGEPPSNSRPTSSSTAASVGSSSAQSRPDLKQSILSLYSSSSRSTTPNQQQQPSQSPGAAAGSQPTRSAFGNLESDFAGLNFGSNAPAQRQSPASSRPVASPPAQGFSPPPQQTFSPPPQQTFSPPPQQNFGGGFFDAKPASATTTSKSSTPGTGGRLAEQQQSFDSSGGFGGFETATSPGAYSFAPKSNPLGDLDFSKPSVAPAKSPQPVNPPNQQNSPFNISSSPKPAQTTPMAKSPAPATTSAGLMNMDPWGSNDVWSSSASTNTAAAAVAPPLAPKATPTVSAAADDWGWTGESNSAGGFGSTSGRPTQITADEDFGGWESSTMASPTHESKSSGLGFSSQQSSSVPPTTTSKPLTFPANNEDLFSNVWE